MKQQNDRAPFDWCNYSAALMSGALCAALAAAAILTVVASIMATEPMTDMSLSGILKFLLIRMIALPFTFALIFLFAAVVTSGATLVFGSLILALVRGTRFESLFTFAAAGFLSGYMMMVAFAYANAGVNVEALLSAIIGGLAGLAGGWAFGYRVCFPVSTGCTSRVSRDDETRLTRFVRFLLVR